MSKRRELIIFGCVGILPVLLFYVTYIFGEWYPVTDGPPDEGSQILLWVPMLPFMLLLLLSIAGVVFVAAALVISLFIKRILCPRLQIFCALFAITFVVGWFATGEIYWMIRRATFERVAQRGEVIIQAIDTYHTQESKLPKSLNDLVPKYIDKIPGTVIRAYPNFEYEIPQTRDTYYTEPYKKHKALYELRVNCPSGGLNWDCFFYWPSQDYPDRIYGGVTEKIGKWVYVHE